MTELGSSTCPYCGQPIGAQESERIHHREEQQAEALRVRMEREFGARVTAERRAAEEAAAQKYHDELSEAGERLHSMQAKLESAREEFDLRLRTELIETKERAEADARRGMQEQVSEMSMNIQQKDKLLELMKKQVDELKAKVESKEGAIDRGVLQEEQLLRALRAEFPWDNIERVRSGGGADITHRVLERGQDCGLIIYESKRVQTWNYEWLEKLTQEKVKTGANYGVLVSTVFPPREQNFCMSRGIPVVHPNHLVPFVTFIRGALVAIKINSQSMEEAEYKYGQLLNYLSSAEFKNRISEVLRNMEKLSALQDKEKKAHDRVWSEQTQIHRRTTRVAVEIQTEISSILGGNGRLREIA
jgi:hypothetical protein